MADSCEDQTRLNQQPLQDLTRLSDEQLMDLYRQGRDQCFVVLVERYRRELFQFLARFIGNASWADDLFQETFLQVHLSVGTFDKTRTFKPWLFTIAANKARDKLRKEKRQATISLSAPVDQNGDSPKSFVDLLEGDEILPPEGLAKAEMRQKVREVIDLLPPHQKEVLLMAYFHQFGYKEIAQMLGIPLGTVKSRLHTAVGTFAQIWKSQQEARK